MPRLPYASIAPDGYRHWKEFLDYLHKSGLEAGLLNLVFLRISQINGCAYCVDAHWRDARQAGEDDQRLNGLVVWRDTPFFTERERAALAWAEAVTRLPDGQVSEERFAAVRGRFNDKELVDLTLAAAHMNALNRVAIAMHVTPAVRKPRPESGLD
jgi:AhpD family alkylhydroperoxidase